MTAKVCKKCRFRNITTGNCPIKQRAVQPWDDACASYDLRPELALCW